MTTITEGLAELKTLRKRIDTKRSGIMQYLARAEAVRDPLEKQGGSEAHIRAERQAIDDLEENYIALRRRIAEANASTTITVGGITRSITDWLVWRRELAAFRSAWLTNVRQGVQGLRQKTSQRGGAIYASASVGAEAKPDDIVVNIDERALDAEIEKLEEILSTLDGQLSLKNATTEI
jgi:hypothetical protein